MKLFADLRRWIGGALDWMLPVDETEDSLSAIQQQAIARNRAASEENCAAANTTAAAIHDLLAKMEARRNDTD